MVPILIGIFVIALLLNFVWEYVHYVLYVCTIDRLWCAEYTAFVDALLTLGIYVVVAFLVHDRAWIFSLNKKNIVILFMVSAIVAIVVEWQGLHLEKWTYAQTMPIIPLLNIGLSPFLQMILLSLATLLIVRFLIEQYTL